MKLLLALLFIVSTAYAEDRCMPLLASGVFDNIIKNENSTNSEEKHDFYCSKDFENYANNRSRNESFGFSYGGYGFNFASGGDNSSEMTKLHQACDEHYSNINNTHYLNYATRTASKPILDAYVECIRLTSSQELISLTLDDYGDMVTVNLKFRGVTGMDLPVIQKSIVGGSLRCEWNSIKEGAKIPLEGLFDYCQRISPDAGIIIIKTNLGDYKVTVDKKTGPVANPIQATYSVAYDYVTTTTDTIAPMVTTVSVRNGFMPSHGPVRPSTAEFDVQGQYPLGSYSIQSCVYKTGVNGQPRDWTPCASYNGLTISQSDISESHKKITLTNSSSVIWNLTLAFSQTRTVRQTKSQNDANLDVLGSTFDVILPATTTKAIMDITLTKLNRTIKVDVLNFSKNDALELTGVSFSGDNKKYSFKVL